MRFAYRKTIISLAVLVLLSACHDDKKDVQSDSKESSLNQTPHNIDTKGLNLANTPLDKSSSNTNAEKNQTLQSETKTQTFTHLNNSKVVNTHNLALDFYQKNLLQYSILVYMEGFVGHFYQDNIGPAILFGVNLYYQKPNKMQEVTNGLLDSETQQNFIRQAGVKEILPSSRNVNISVDNGVEIMKRLSLVYLLPSLHVFCPSATNVGQCPDYDNLSDNEKAFMFYNNWNAGSFAKMPKISAALRNYAHNKTQANKDTVKNMITYTYRLNGKVIENYKEEALQQAMWNNKEQYLSLITNNPHFISGVNIASLNSSIPALKNANITLNSTQSDKPLIEQMPDPIGEAKEKAIETNTPLNLELYKANGSTVNGYSPEPAGGVAKPRTKVLGFI